MLSSSSHRSHPPPVKKKFVFFFSSNLREFSPSLSPRRRNFYPKTASFFHLQMATRQENLGSSGKRARGPNLYLHLLPLLPTPPSFISSFLSSIPSLSLNPTQIQAVYDELTGMIRVHDERDMELLWRRGFFGKGSLSRSEPSWRRRVENKIALAEGREQSTFCFDHT